jgi:hypothetical protein
MKHRDELIHLGKNNDSKDHRDNGEYESDVFHLEYLNQRVTRKAAGRTVISVEVAKRGPFTNAPRSSTAI